MWLLIRVGIKVKRGPWGLIYWRFTNKVLISSQIRREGLCINIWSALIQIMVWRRTGDKPYSAPMMTWFIDAYMHQPASMSWYNLCRTAMENVKRIDLERRYGQTGFCEIFFNIFIIISNVVIQGGPFSQTVLPWCPEISGLGWFWTGVYIILGYETALICTACTFVFGQYYSSSLSSQYAKLVCIYRWLVTILVSLARPIDGCRRGTPVESRWREITDDNRERIFLIRNK